MSRSTHFCCIENSVVTFRFFKLVVLSLFSALCSISPPTLASDIGKTDSALQAVIVRIDNDIFAGSDRGYSNGINVGFLSQKVDDFQDPRLPAGYRWLNHGLRWLQPKDWDQYNMALSVGHGIFTPGDWRARELVEEDRPYAGVLVAGVDYNGRSDNRMQSTSVDLGIVGPSALGEELQKSEHYPLRQLLFLLEYLHTHGLTRSNGRKFIITKHLPNLV